MVKKAVVLAAGEGNRLRPFTENMPKVMLPVGNKPIIEYLIKSISDCGIREIVLVVGYKKETIMEYFGDGKDWNVEIKYVFQDKQIGTGHALLQAEEKVKEKEFLVLPGDNIIDNESLRLLIESKAPSLIVEKSDSPSKYGVVDIDAEVVKRILEKPSLEERAIVSTGMYKLKKEIFDILKDLVKNGRNSLTDAINEIAKKERIGVVKGKGKWKDAVYPWDLLTMNADVLRNLSSNISGKIERNVVIKGPVQIGEDTIIHPNCYIRGPVVIGKGCEIGPNVCILPSTSIGDDATIHPFTEIRNSIVMKDVSIGSNSLIENSVIGEGCRISSHFSTLAGKSAIEIENGFHRVDNIGGFIGGGCVIDSMVTLESGTIVGKGCRISSLKILRGRLDSGSRVV
ncbi:MAG: hypothetical protein DRN18_00325 [Thermoplasmata archaeon]|nr:MAG: hypothetical protein DRN18_00325 [Thermoplasmata archaeon]